jgi:hypothetical protein
LLGLLTTLLLIVHLLLVNVAAGAPIVCVWLEWRGGDLARRASRYLGGMAVTTLLVGGLVGVLLGWLRWTPEYRALWTGPLSYKLHWGGAELLVSLLLAIGYWLLVRGRGGESARARVGRGLLALLHGTNLLYHFPPLFVVAAKLHDTGQVSGAAIRGAAFRQLAWSGELPALSLHVALASVAMAGIMLLGLALRLLKSRAAGDDAARVAGWGGMWALSASLLQLPVGLWTLLMLPAAMQSPLLGNEPLATMLFFSAMLAALWLLRELVGVAWGEMTRPTLIRAMTAMLATVALMTAMQQQVRPAHATRAAPAAKASLRSGAVP